MIGEATLEISLSPCSLQVLFSSRGVCLRSAGFVVNQFEWTTICGRTDFSREMFCKSPAKIVGVAHIVVAVFLASENIDVMEL